MNMGKSTSNMIFNGTYKPELSPIHLDNASFTPLFNRFNKVQCKRRDCHMLHRQKWVQRGKRKGRNDTATNYSHIRRNYDNSYRFPCSITTETLVSQPLITSNTNMLKQAHQIHNIRVTVLFEIQNISHIDGMYYSSFHHHKCRLADRLADY